MHESCVPGKRVNRCTYVWFVYFLLQGSCFQISVFVTWPRFAEETSHIWNEFAKTHSFFIHAKSGKCATFKFKSKILINFVVSNKAWLTERSLWWPLPPIPTSCCIYVYFKYVKKWVRSGKIAFQIYSFGPLKYFYFAFVRPKYRKPLTPLVSKITTIFDWLTDNYIWGFLSVSNMWNWDT